MKYVFANWKMYLNVEETLSLVDTLVEKDLADERCAISFFPTMLALTDVQKKIIDTAYGIGAQNASWVPQGAYTGATSALFCKQVGCDYVLVGHSERRHIFHETDEAVRKKIDACIDAKITPVVCIGETKAEYDAGLRDKRLEEQLEIAFSNLKTNGQDIVVAYEPVWAIGTGDACDPIQAAEVHTFITKKLRTYFDQDIPVIYGGSVDANNVVSYLKLDIVSGVLVGGASTKLDTFVPLIESVKQIS